MFDVSYLVIGSLVPMALCVYLADEWYKHRPLVFKSVWVAVIYPVLPMLMVAYILSECNNPKIWQPALFTHVVLWLLSFVLMIVRGIEVEE